MAVVTATNDALGERFDSLELIGQGGSGAVFRAEDRQLGRTVAVKVLRPTPTSPDPAPDPDVVPAEARSQAAVSWHGNILTLLDSGFAPDGAPYLVLELAEGGSLRSRVEASGAMPRDVCLEMAGQLAAALAAAHDRGLVHCDVKPSNVLFAADGSVRLADFGIARLREPDTSTLEFWEGSLGFAPPELLDGVRPSEANDVYGLGLTLHYAASGEVPFHAPGLPTAAVIARVHAASLRKFSELLGDLPPDVAALLDRCVAKDPAERPRAAEVHAAIRRAQDELRRDHPPSRRRPPVRRPLQMFGVAALVAVLVGTVLVASRSDNSQALAPLTEADFCVQYEEVVSGRVALFGEVAEDLELSPSPLEVVERLLVRYPGEFGRMVHPVIEAAGELGGVTTQVTESQLALMTQADVLRALTGGKEFLFDGQSGSVDAATAPRELRATAQAFSEMNAFGSEACGIPEPDLGAGKARMYSAIFSNLANPAFMEGFFADPKSLELFDTSLAMLMASMARPFFEDLLDGHWVWFFELLERNEDLRQALALEQPDVFLLAATREPDLLPDLRRTTWLEGIRVGIERSSPMARRGLLEVYPELLAELGLVQG